MPFYENDERRKFSRRSRIERSWGRSVTLVSTTRRRPTIKQSETLAIKRVSLGFIRTNFGTSAATRLRWQFGLDAARVILGHSSPIVTEVYGEVDREKAIAVMERVG